MKLQKKLSDRPELAGERVDPYSRERIEEDISICLNCERARCTGNCMDIERSRKEIARERKAKKYAIAE